MTLRINFSHKYNKMPYGFESSKLLDVLPIRLEDLSLDFILYDTSYLDGGEEKLYALPAKGAYMILLLQANSGAGPIWTTIRSQWPPEKLEYYRGKRGEVFECQITE
jgi:hypothetical protein